MDETELTIRWEERPSRSGTSHPCLVVLSGMGVGQVFQLLKHEAILGRNPQCEIPLSGEGVSRRHCRFLLEGDSAVWVEDLDSTNGTFVNGKRIERQDLNDGDRIQVGPVTILKFTLQDELEEKLQTQLYQAAIRDPLTHAYNRRFFQEESGRAVSHAMRHGAPLTIIMLDLDHFKAVNDTYGHQAGDAVLQAVASELGRGIRHEDVLCRIGGEEFAILARSTTLVQATLAAERLRSRVEALVVAHDNHNLKVTISLGVAELLGDKDADSLVARADRALYRAKAEGRNKVAVDGPTSERP